MAKDNAEEPSTSHAQDDEREDIFDFQILDEPMLSPLSESTISLQSPVPVTERENLSIEIDILISERDNLKLQNMELQMKVNCNSSPFTMDTLARNPNKCKMLTGIEYDILKKLLVYLCEDIIVIGEGRPAKYSNGDQIIITLIKLKQNVTFDFLAHISNISRTTAI